MGFIIAAVITAVVTALVVGTVALRAAGTPWRWPLIALACALPLHAISFFFVRLPVHGILKAQVPPDTLFWIGSLYAPVFEEPAKWLVLFLPFVRIRLTPQNAIGMALATGLGFGLGEIATLTALTLLNTPEQTHLPFYIYTGFLVERLIVCFLHGAFVAFMAQRLSEGRWVVPGMLIGMVLHYLVNLPIALMQMQAFGLSAAWWRDFSMPWLLILAAGLGVVLATMLRRKTHRALLGETTCEACHQPFERSLVALNLGPWKLQRCPHCRKWQFN